MKYKDEPEVHRSCTSVGEEISGSFYAVSISSRIDKVLRGPTDLGRLESDTAEPPLKGPPQDWGEMETYHR